MSPVRNTKKKVATKKVSTAKKTAGTRAKAVAAKSAGTAPARTTNLVIVESPAKARTIGPLLGSAYTVKASLGHVRDLPKSRLGVAVDDEFEPKYLVPKEKKSVVDDLKSAAKRARNVFLATDPDREGEAISWHLVEAADIKGMPVRRVVFHEITPEAIKEAFLHPRDIDMNLVNAQQARRVMDRLVGYSLSPILWRKIRGGLSAGRVQSAALRMIVDREREIDNFVPKEYWSIDVSLSKEQLAAARGRGRSKEGAFRATLVNLAGKRGKIEIPDQATADKLTAELRPAAYKVSQVGTKQSQRQPQPPFTTSTLQQEASRKLGFTAQRTMSVAQQLYEGLVLGHGAPAGLITYMRTDSVRVAESAIHQTRQFIQQKYGGDFVPRSPRLFTTRSRGAQEAHEAIRPTIVGREPDAVRQFLSADQFRLYDLIWKRMVASQMANATLETLSVDIEALNPASNNRYLLRAISTRVVFPGYQLLYQESSDDDQDAAQDSRLPDLAQGEALSLVEVLPLQHFTQPPPRYTDATLVKALEANGIGRPSTYAAILSTLQTRGYARKERRQYVPEEIGYLVNDLLAEHFPGVVDLEFTAHMEDELDEIAEGSQQWVPVVREFYTPFALEIKRADEVIPKVEFKPEPTGEMCERCGKPMVLRVGRFGPFQACSGFPECRNAKPILKTIGVKCPKCATGELVEKKGRARGRIFYGCANYPNCDFTSWDRPIADPCPQCGGLMVQPQRRGQPKCTQCSYVREATARGRGKAVAAEPVPALAH